MRRLLPLLAAAAVLACGASSSGNYSLVSVSGAALPAPIVFDLITITHTSGSLTLTSDSTFVSTLTFYEEDGDPETSDVSGKFTLDELNVLRFTPGPGSEDGPFEGKLDGNQITIPVENRGTLVFRR